MIISEFIHGKYKHFLSLFLFFAILLWFDYLKKTIIPTHIIYSRLDSYVPFVKQFVVPYLFWYVYIVFGFWYLGVVSKKDFYKLYLFLFIGMSIACIIYKVFPNAQFPRPKLVDKDIFSRTIEFIYTVDATNNVCPSIHVINTIGIWIALEKCDKFKDKHLLRAASSITAVLICASTVFIKQHSVIDMGAAIIICILLYLCIYVFPRLLNLKYGIYKKHEEGSFDDINIVQ